MSVGLGGDGDELFAVDDLERAFGVKLDPADAPKWHTAGDLFLSLKKALPDSDSPEAELWDRFVEALSAQTGVDPTGIEKDSPLLSRSRFWTHVANASAAIWIFGAVILMTLFGWALLKG